MNLSLRRMLAAAALLCRADAAPAGAPEPIDRRAVVARHDPVLREFDVESPLSVGNGEFAFTADVTGLQTFPAAYEQTIPLCTLSQWGWHTAPNPDGWSIERFAFTEYDSHGRAVGYADIPRGERTPEVNWLRGNPHRLHLGRIGLRLTRADGRLAQLADIASIEQTLSLWEGRLLSRFEFDGHPVEVQTMCHPDGDLLAIRIASPLLLQGRVGVCLEFPYGTGRTAAADWDSPGAHQTEVTRVWSSGARLLRRLDADAYHVGLRWSAGAALDEAGRHKFLITPPPDGASALELAVAFSPEPIADDLPAFDEARASVAEHWSRFWESGGAIDLSRSRDPRWRELERRIVLSQYLTAIQCAGRYPPQESGLTCNSWEGKFHLEMHWWHAVHFALWGRIELLERSLGFYRSVLPRASETARRQGYAGARWPKMTDPSGAESPSTVGPFLIWQQPHPIYYAELCRRAHGDRATLEQFWPVVEATAEFMASYAASSAAAGRCVLGPPLQCAQEVFPKERTLNPTFELTYWRWGLETARRWRELLGLPADPMWDRAVSRLAPLPVSDGKYLFTETTPDSYTDPRWARDHPVVTAALGMLPGPGVDPETMRATLHWILERWDWPSTWGWDYPMVAMCAARLGEPERALDALLLDTPKNHYRRDGHNHQRPGLTVYLPGNGGLLAAAAMMAAGWDGAPDRHAPGFPATGAWDVRWDGLCQMP